MKKLTRQQIATRNALIEENYKYFISLIVKLRWVLFSFVFIMLLFQFWIPFALGTIVLGLTFTFDSLEVRARIEKKVDKEIEKYL